MVSAQLRETSRPSTALQMASCTKNSCTAARTQKNNSRSATARQGETCFPAAARALKIQKYAGARGEITNRSPNSPCSTLRNAESIPSVGARATT